MKEKNVILNVIFSFIVALFLGGLAIYKYDSVFLGYAIYFVTVVILIGALLLRIQAVGIKDS